MPVQVTLQSFGFESDYYSITDQYGQPISSTQSDNFLQVPIGPTSIEVDGKTLDTWVYAYVDEIGGGMVPLTGVDYSTVHGAAEYGIILSAHIDRNVMQYASSSGTTPATFTMAPFSGRHAASLYRQD